MWQTRGSSSCHPSFASPFQTFSMDSSTRWMHKIHTTAEENVPPGVPAEQCVVSQSPWVFAAVSWGKSRPWRRRKAVQRPLMSSCVQSPESWWRIRSSPQVEPQLIKVYSSLSELFLCCTFFYYCCVCSPQMVTPMRGFPLRAGSRGRIKPVRWPTCPCRPPCSPPTDLWSRPYHGGSPATRLQLVSTHFSEGRSTGRPVLL